MESKLNKEMNALMQKLKTEKDKNIQLSKKINELEQKLFSEKKINLELNHRTK